MADLNDIPLNIHLLDNGWESVDRPEEHPQVRQREAMDEGWLEVTGQDGNLRTAPAVMREVNVALPEVAPAENRRLQAFNHDRAAMAQSEAQARINRLPQSEAVRQSLKTAVTARLNEASVTTRLNELAGPAELDALVSELVQAEERSLTDLQNRFNQVKQEKVLAPLAQAAQMPEEQVEAMCGGGFEVIKRAFDATLARVFATAPRDAQGGFSQETLASMLEEAGRTADQLAQNRLVLLATVNDSALGDDMKTQLRRELVSLPSQVIDAAKVFCDGGADRAALTEAVKLIMQGEALDDNILTEIELQPLADVSLQQALEVIMAATHSFNAAQVAKFVRMVNSEFPVLDAEAFRHALKLDELKSHGVEMTEARRAKLTARLEELREGGDRLQAVIDELRQRPEFQGQRNSFWSEVSNLRTERLAAGKVSAADILTFKADVEKLLRGERSFDETLSYLLTVKHSDWTPAQKRLLSETLKFLHRMAPGENIRAYGPGLATLAQIITNQHGSIWMADADPLTFLKVAAMTSFTPFCLPLIYEKMPELSAAFAQKGDRINLKDVFRVLFGKETKAPKTEDSLESLSERFIKEERLLLDKLAAKTWVQYSKFKQEVWDHMEAEGELNNLSDEGKNAKVLENMVYASKDWLNMDVNWLSSMYLKPSVAVGLLFGPRHFDLTLFAEPPRITLGAAGSKNQAEAQFMNDFFRGGDNEEEVGQLSYEVIQSDGSRTKIHNGREGFQSEADIQRFEQAHMCTKSRRFFNALQKLCAGNEVQYRLALQTMSQGGFRSMCVAAHGKGDQTSCPMDYKVSRNDQGCLIITAVTSREDDPNRFDFAMTITPEGKTVYTKVDISNTEYDKQFEADVDGSEWTLIGDNVKKEPTFFS